MCWPGGEAAAAAQGVRRGHGRPAPAGERALPPERKAGDAPARDLDAAAGVLGAVGDQQPARHQAVRATDAHRAERRRGRDASRPSRYDTLQLNNKPTATSSGWRSGVGPALRMLGLGVGQPDARAALGRGYHEGKRAGWALVDPSRDRSSLVLESSQWSVCSRSLHCAAPWQAGVIRFDGVDDRVTPRWTHSVMDSRRFTPPPTYRQGQHEPMCL